MVVGREALAQGLPGEDFVMLCCVYFKHLYLAMTFKLLQYRFLKESCFVCCSTWQSLEIVTLTSHDAQHVDKALRAATNGYTRYHLICLYFLRLFV